MEPPRHRPKMPPNEAANEDGDTMKAKRQPKRHLNEWEMKIVRWSHGRSIYSMSACANRLTEQAIPGHEHIATVLDARDVFEVHFHRDRLGQIDVGTVWNA